MGCFQILAIINNVSMNIGVDIPFSNISVWISLDIFSEVKPLGHKTVSFLIFWGNTILFSTVAAPVCIPTNTAKVFPFLHILANMLFEYLFMIAILIRVGWYLIVVLIGIFLIINDEHLFVCLLAICMPFLNLVVCRGVSAELYVFNEFWILTPYQMYHQICCFIQWILFAFCWWFPYLCCAESFNLI